MKHHSFIKPLAAALLASITLSACHRANPPTPTVRPVVTMAVQGGPESTELNVPGEIQPRYRTNLSFRVPGNLLERNVRLGDTVKVGQVLATLDPSDFKKNASIAHQQLEIAQQHLTLTRNQVDRDRLQAHDNLIPATQLEQTETNYAAAQAQTEQARQQLELATNQLHYAVLVADRTGVISAESANTGDNVAAGQSVFQLTWNKDVDVDADVSESIIAGIAPGAKATITLPSLPGIKLDATVREIAPEADPGSRTFKVKLTLHQTDGVRLGSTAQIYFSASKRISESNTISIPSTALFHDGQQAAVWVVQPNNTLVLRPVQITRYTENTVWVAHGLASGERIVMQGVHTVSAGQVVQPIAPIHSESAPATPVPLPVSGAKS